MQVTLDISPDHAEHLLQLLTMGHLLFPDKIDARMRLDIKKQLRAQGLTSPPITSNEERSCRLAGELFKNCYRSARAVIEDTDDES